VDSTVALPLITAYALDHVKPRKPKRLIDARDQHLKKLSQEYYRSPLYKKFFDH
jgi:deoxyhypusine synthase